MKIDKLLDILTRLERIKISAAFFNCQRGKSYGFVIINHGKIRAKCLAPVEQGQEILLVKEGSQWYFFPTSLTRNARYKRVVSYRKIYHRSQSETILPFKIIYQVGDKVYVGGHIKKPVLVNTLDVPLYSDSDAFVTNLGKKNFTTFTRFDRYANDLYKSQGKNLRVYQAQTYPYYWGGSSLVLNEPDISYTTEQSDGSGFCPLVSSIHYIPDNELTFGSGTGEFTGALGPGDDPNSVYCSYGSRETTGEGDFLYQIGLIPGLEDIVTHENQEQFALEENFENQIVLDTGINESQDYDYRNDNDFDFNFQNLNFRRDLLEIIQDNYEKIADAGNAPLEVKKFTIAETKFKQLSNEETFLIYQGLDFSIYYQYQLTDNYHLQTEGRFYNSSADTDNPIPSTNAIVTYNGTEFGELERLIYNEPHYDLTSPIHGEELSAQNSYSLVTTYQREYALKYRYNDTTFDLDNSTSFLLVKELNFTNPEVSFEVESYFDAKTFHNQNISFQGKEFKYYYSQLNGGNTNYYEVTGEVNGEIFKYYDSSFIEDNSLYNYIRLSLTLRRTSLRQIPYFHRNHCLIINPNSFNGFCLYLNYYVDFSTLLKGSKSVTWEDELNITNYREVVDRRNNISSKGNSVYLSHVDYNSITENDGVGYTYRFNLAEDKIVLDDIIQAKIFSLSVDESLGVNYFFTSYHD